MATPQLSPGVLVREVDLTVGRADNVLDNIDVVDTLKDVITSIRTIRSELNIAPSKKIDVLISVSYTHLTLPTICSV